MMRTRNFFIAVAGIFLMSGCKQQQPATPEIDIMPSEVPHKSVSLPAVDPPLDRQAILVVASQAASNFALGRDDGEAQKQLDGRRFAMRLRFGCDGPEAKSAPGSRSWSFDEKRRVLSFKVMLDVELERLPIASASEAGLEAVEGFWIERPWMLQAGCPRVPSPIALSESSATPKPIVSDVPSSPNKAQPGDRRSSTSRQVGIAQFLFVTEARTHRRADRAYATTKVLPPDASPSKDGYDLVVSGRLRGITDGRVITCWTDTPATSPNCIVSIEVETVSIETPGGGETIATWTGAF